MFLKWWMVYVFIYKCSAANFIRQHLNNLYPPRQPHDGPVPVKVGMYIESVGSFQSSQMSFDADFYLYMSWKDRNLSHTFPQYQMITDLEVLRSIWIPDLYLSNSRISNFHDVLVPNFSIFIDENGHLAYSGRITATVACNFDLETYPMDRQLCKLKIVSYAYIASQVNITWFDEDPIRYSTHIHLPEFYIESISSSQCDGTYRYAITEENYREAPFSCLSTNILLKRSAAYHVVQSYLPSALIVMISWVSFWIDRRAVHARITLWFTTLLSLFTLHMGVKNGLPESSSVSALDWWFGVCMVMVFGTLVELAMVNTYMRKADKFERMAQSLAREKLSRKESWSTISTINSDHDDTTAISRLTISYYADNKDNMDEEVDSPRLQELQIGLEFAKQAFQVDNISRLIFPLVFSGFNGLYWGFFLYIRDRTEYVIQP
ncbi:unnamed protein product [Bursaphelenchus xylophilus]|uniref:(pine wood nematode) hypothetical protein n=1 Tax=Bursaphelenchus xylophilus TaxID=6326 RepID=A0A1I7S424_BURXY|nr:unnamed protein product [Bursaphelenchus xylophilus]CAG9116647.1 unnamed protein product [Bursaphelenchus xylophilus]